MSAGAQRSELYQAAAEFMEDELTRFAFERPDARFTLAELLASGEGWLELRIGPAVPTRMLVVNVDSASLFEVRCLAGIENNAPRVTALRQAAARLIEIELARLDSERPSQGAAYRALLAAGEGQLEVRIGRDNSAMRVLVVDRDGEALLQVHSLAGEPRA
jgi:hypothetical protein